MKICVLVKEVPDAAVEKRIDPSTGRMDRSGEKNLNPYDTHAIEAAMQIKEGGAVAVEEIVAVTMGPDSAVRALHKAVSLGADRSVHLSDPARRRLRRGGDRLCAGQDAAAREPDLVLLGQQSDDGECYTIGAVVAEHLGMPSLTQVIKMDVESDGAALRAPGRVRLRHGPDQAAGGDLRRRRDQRAALPVAEGDHGRQEEAAGHGHAPPMCEIDPAKVGGENSAAQWVAAKAPPAKAAGEIIEDEDTGETVEKIIAWLDERKLI